MTSTGTVGVKFKASPGIDSEFKINDGLKLISTKHICITSMREYKDKSLEELRWEDYKANRKGTHQVKGELFGSSGNPTCLSTWRPTFPEDRNKFNLKPNVKPSIFGTMEHNSPSSKPDIFGSMDSSSSSIKPTPFGNKCDLNPNVKPSLFRNMEHNSPSSKPDIFGSMDSSSSSIKPSPFGTTKNNSNLVKPGLFGSTEMDPNSSISGSIFGSSPSSVNSSPFTSMECNSPFANTNSSSHKPPNPLPQFGTTMETKPFGNTNIFGFSGTKPNLGNTNNFSFIESQPSFSSKNIFGFPAFKAGLEPTFGNASTSKDVQVQPETPSFALRTNTNPSKMDNKLTFGTKDTLFNLPSKTSTLNNKSSLFSFGSTKKTLKLKKPVTGTSAASSKTNTSQEAADQQGGFEEVHFSNSKILGLQGKLTLHNPELEYYAEGVKKMVFDLQGLIECLVCFASLDSSLKQCENGHGICGSCNSNVEKCPTCQHIYLPYKPILLWQILDRLPKPCLFADKGCDKILFSRKEEHETFCKFRPTSCKFQSCEWKGTVEAVTEHVRTCKNGTEYSLCEIHFPNVKANNLYKFIKTQDTTLCSAVIFENQLFWKHFQRDSLSKMISYKFYHITPTTPKQKYYLVVSFSKGEIEFKLCVAASYDTEKNSEDKKCNEMSFYLSDEDLDRFYDPKTEGYRYTQHIVVEDICSEKISP